MFLLDTNVLSAMMQTRGDPMVKSWMSRQSADRLFTSAICRAEILAGVAVLTEGRRRSALEAASLAMFAKSFQGRIWDFDSNAALAYAEVFARRRRSGQPTGHMDLLIAAIALARGATLVTRNVPDFRGCGFAIINPWMTV